MIEGTDKNRLLRMHAYNYVLMESGIREFCSKCASCCDVCHADDLSVKKDNKFGKIGCRNELCLFHICDNLRSLLDDKRKFVTHDGSLTLISMINNCRPFTKADLHFVKTTMAHLERGTRYRLEGIEWLVTSSKSKDSRLNRMRYRKKHGRPKVYMPNIEAAKKFDAQTIKLFAEVK